METTRSSRALLACRSARGALSGRKGPGPSDRGQHVQAGQQPWQSLPQSSHRRLPPRSAARRRRRSTHSQQAFAGWLEGRQGTWQPQTAGQRPSPAAHEPPGPTSSPARPTMGSPGHSRHVDRLLEGGGGVVDGGGELGGAHAAGRGHGHHLGGVDVKHRLQPAPARLGKGGWGKESAG